MKNIILNIEHTFMLLFLFLSSTKSIGFYVHSLLSMCVKLELFIKLNLIKLVYIMLYLAGPMFATYISTCCGYLFG